MPKRATNESLLLCLFHQVLSANHQAKLYSFDCGCCKYPVIFRLPHEACGRTDFSSLESDYAAAFCCLGADSIVLRMQLHLCSLVQLGMTRTPRSACILHQVVLDPRRIQRPGRLIRGRGRFCFCLLAVEEILGKSFVLCLRISATSVPNCQTDQTAPSISLQSRCKTMNPLFRLPFLFEMF